MTTMPAAAASSPVTAETPSPRAETTDASDSGLRLLAITTSRPARRAVRAIACPSRPAPMIPTMLPRSRPSGLPVVFGCEQVAHCKAPIRPPAVRHLSYLVLGGKVVEAVRPLDRATEREVAREEHVGPVERDEQEPARGPQPDSGDLGQGRLDLLVRHARKRLVAQMSVDEPL